MKFLLSVIILVFTANFGFAQQAIVIFSESPNGDEFYEPSWGFASGNSFVERVNSVKFPVDTGHPFDGNHSLRLRWKSAPIGDWGIAVAAIGWPGNDFTQFDSITYQINGPAAISQADLPDIGIEDVNNVRSERVWLGDWFSGVDADSTTWQRVSVPVSAFSPGTQNCDFTKIKTIFHFQKSADNVLHTAWLDEIIVRKANGTVTAPDPPQNFVVSGHDSRIDLRWDRVPSNIAGYYVYRSASATGTFSRVNNFPQALHFASDFLGENDLTRYYFVTAVNQALEESEPSDTLSASTFAMTDEQLLTSVQEALFRYFWDFGHPVSGLARERNTSLETCTSGGTGFGLMAIVTGAERGFVSRDSAAARTLKILRFLKNDAQRYQGAWAHWINGTTGATIPFSQFDDGADLVETSYLVMGMLTSRQYFTENNAVETEIRDLATELWEGVDWDFFRKNQFGTVLYWHWSPNYKWQMNLQIRGFNETMITYLLAIASPTNPVPASLYQTGWAGGDYVNGNTFYGHFMWVGPDWGGPLFFTQYTFLGFDPRNKSDQFCNYFENNRNTSLVHWEYGKRNPRGHAGYDSLGWGLTASDDPFGYTAHAPFTNDNGTITPTAALSAMPYTPEQSIATLRYFYHELGEDLWGPMGFYDAYNMDENWFARSYIAIDQGPIIGMIENYRSELQWNLFMSNPEIQPMLDAIGFTTVGIADDPPVAGKFALEQNFPNPFNGETIIRFSLPQSETVTLEIFNTLGESVGKTIENKAFIAGTHEHKIDANRYTSGVYFYRITAGDFQKTRKMLLIK